MDFRTEQAITALKKFLPMIGQAAAVAWITFHYEGEGEYDIDIGGEVNISVGTLIEVPSILGGRKAPGYRVFYWKTHSNYPHAPDDVEDVTVYEGHSLEAALTAVGEVYAKDAATRILESLWSNEDQLPPPEEHV